jgi:hypothetical protein
MHDYELCTNLEEMRKARHACGYMRRLVLAVQAVRLPFCLLRKADANWEFLLS